MPWSTLLACAALAPAAFGIGCVVAGLGFAIGQGRVRRSAHDTWIERARQAFPARRVAMRDAILVPLAVGEFVYLGGVPAVGYGPTVAPWAIVVGLAGFLGVMTAVQTLDRRIRRKAGTPAPEGIGLFWIFMLCFYCPFGLTLALIPTRWGWTAAAVLVLGATLVTWILRGGWLVPLRWCGWVRPSSQRLEAVVAHAAARVGVRPRRTFELASPQSNALALQIPRFVVFVGPIASVLDDDELGAITAHELGHLAEPRAVYLTRAAVAYLPVVAVAAIPLGGSFGLWAGLVPLALFLSGVIVLRRVGRRMELRSDRVGREHEGESVGTYARALEKIHEANLMPAVLRGRREIHPHLYDRLLAAGATPAYARPAPPPRDVLAEVPGFLLLIALIAAYCWGPAASVSSEQHAAYLLGNQAQSAFDEGELERAAVLYGRAAELDPATPLFAANQAAVLLWMNRVAEAEAALSRAEAVMTQHGSNARYAAPLIRSVRSAIEQRREIPRAAGAGARAVRGEAPAERATARPAG
jgi:Zn-dependent protease with chaperone function